MEEDNADNERQNNEKDLSEKDGERSYKIVTPVGNALFITIPEIQKRNFTTKAIIHVMLSKNPNLDKKELIKFLTSPKDDDSFEKWAEEHLDPDEVRFIVKSADKSINYFLDNLKEAFAFNIRNYFEESHIYGLMKSNTEEKREPLKTEIDIFNEFAKFSESKLKERLGVQKASGAKTKRTEQQLQEMAFFYDLSLPLVKEAKKSYTLVKKKSNWVQSIKALHPDVPLNIIEKFDQGGMTPSDLTLMWITDFFNIEQTDYLRQQLIKTRKSITKKTPITKEIIEDLFGWSDEG